jgi:hypothetical protein
MKADRAKEEAKKKAVAEREKVKEPAKVARREED